MKLRGGSPPRPAAGGGGSDATLPPLARAAGGSGTLPKLGRGGSKDCAAAAAAAHKEAALALGGEASEGSIAAVHRSPLSGSSKAPFPADRTFTNDFQWTLRSRDLPAEVRPIIEDNKMLQEELRRYKMRVGEQEGQLAARERQLVALRDELARERQRLRDCAVSPEQLLQDRQFRAELEQKEVALQHAQRQAAILEKAKAAAERRLACDLAAERRQQAELRRQLQQAQEDMAEKQKQARFNQLHINQLYRRLEPLEAAVAAAAAPPAPPPPPPPEERVQLMLCCVYEQPAPTAAEIAEAAARLAAAEAAAAAAALRRVQEPAAVAIQAAWRGFKARRRLAALHAAATRIQAAARGMLARRALAPLRQQRTTDLEEGSVSPAQRLAQRRQAAEQQYRERLSRPQQRRASVAASARPANTAVEAAARARSQLGTAGQGGTQWPGPPGSSGVAGGGGVAGRRSNRGSIVGALLGRPNGSTAAGGASGAVAGPANSARSSQSGGSPSPLGGSSGGPGGGGSQARHASRASVVGALPLEQLHAQQGRARQLGGEAGSPSTRQVRGSTLGPHTAGGEGQPAKRPSMQLGFASSAPRRSIGGGPM